MSQSNSEELVSNQVQNYVDSLIKDLEITNYTTDISAGSIRGDNYLGIIAKVVVNGEDKNGKHRTLNLIVKSAPRNEMFRALAHIQKAYDREIYIYSKVFPEFAKFQEERGVLKPFKSVAKFYKSTMDHLNEALIMENMKEVGFELRDRHESLDYNHVRFVMREYGKVHALSFALRDQKPELFQELLDNTHEVFFNNYDTSDPAMKAALEEYGHRAIASLDPVKDKVAYDRFKEFIETMFDQVKGVLQPESAGEYAVIGHGDCWVNNLLFKYGNQLNPRQPTEMCFLDWQLSRGGSPALDLSYFLFACTDKELRDEHYDGLIKEYHDSLSQFLRQLGSDPDKLFPFDVLQEHLKKFCVYGLYMSIMVLYLVTSDNEDIPDMHDIKEGDGFEKFQFESRNVEKYYSRVRGIILDFVKFGYEF